MQFNIQQQLNNNIFTISPILIFAYLSSMTLYLDGDRIPHFSILICSILGFTTLKQVISEFCLNLIKYINNIIRKPALKKYNIILYLNFRVYSIGFFYISSLTAFNSILVATEKSINNNLILLKIYLKKNYFWQIKLNNIINSYILIFLLFNVFFLLKKKINTFLLLINSFIKGNKLF